MKKRIAVYLDDNENPLLTEWTDRNHGVWPRVLKGVMEELIRTGAIPMNLVATQSDAVKSTVAADGKVPPKGNAPASPAHLEAGAPLAPLLAGEQAASHGGQPELQATHSIPTEAAPSADGSAAVPGAPVQAKEQEPAQNPAASGEGANAPNLDLARQAALKALQRNTF